MVSQKESTKFVRVINLAFDYDKRKKRFRPTAFQCSSDGSGISAFDDTCREQRYLHTVCEHIMAFYRAPSGFPIIYWRFTTEILPKCKCISYEPSGTNDECHVNISNLDRDQTEDIVDTYINYDSLKCCLEYENHDIKSEESLLEMKKLSNRLKKSWYNE